MTTTAALVPRTLTLAVLLAGAMGSVQAAPPPAAPGQGAEHARIVEHWTPARRAAAIPRDLVIDERGYGYLKLPNGALQPYGHSVAAAAGAQRPMAKPGTGDLTAPDGHQPESRHRRDRHDHGVFVQGNGHRRRRTSARCRSVWDPRVDVQSSFTPTAGAGGVYTANLTGLADGAWTWSVVARDNASNTTTTTPLTEFTVTARLGRRRWRRRS